MIDSLSIAWAIAWRTVTVGGWAGLSVGDEEPDMAKRRLIEREVRVVLDLRHVVGRQIVGEIDVAGQQLGQPRRLLDDRAEDQPV